MNRELICKNIQKDSWDDLKNSIEKNKKLFIVHDLDLNSMFLITV